MNKKGFMGDYAFYFVYIFVMAIVVIVVYMAISQFNDGWQAGTGIDSSSKSLVSSATSRFLATWNWLIVLLLLGILISVIILAFAIRSHPAFAMLAFLVLVVLGGVSVYLANAFYSFASSDGISTYANQFSLVPFIMNNLPYFVVAFGFVFIIVLYAKSRSQSII
jgi:hypothetical protein